jgi:membrane protein implicated in regulation of membrane protease activity
MIACPWCGTNYLSFQSNCTNCGGPLPAVEETSKSPVANENLPTPPSAPRPISDKYVWRLLSTDGWSIAAFVFSLLGIIFSLVGAGLTLGVITAFVGIPFLLLGVAFLLISIWLFVRRYQEMRKIVDVLQTGEATRGQIVEVRENYSVRINEQHPWVIRYQFQANGQSQEGKVTTLNQPGPQLQEGKAVYVLYLPTAPKWNSIYPHP